MNNMLEKTQGDSGTTTTGIIRDSYEHQVNRKYKKKSKLIYEDEANEKCK